MRGMAVEAASGADATELNEIVDVALTAWPASKKRGRRVGALPPFGEDIEDREHEAPAARLT